MSPTGSGDGTSMQSSSTKSSSEGSSLNSYSSEGSSSTLSCVCPPTYTGPLCEVSLVPTCPGDLCNTVYSSAHYIFRSDEGDFVQLPSTSNYCSSIHGYCSEPVPGGDMCTGCQCDFRYTFIDSIGVCKDYYSGNLDSCVLASVGCI